MLVTKQRAANVTGSGHALLAHIRAAGAQGITRDELAAAIGRKRLNPWDIAQLELMLSQGMIRAERRPSSRVHMLEHVYFVNEG